MASREPEKICIASLAPSFSAYFDCHPLQLVTALKMSGFTFVEETIVVLPEILAMRKRMLIERGAPLLGESCPKVIQMIEWDFPHLRRYVPAIPSPMELHGKALKQRYGSNCRTVFFSPCIHKKRENAIKQAMDEVCTFSELEDLLAKNITIPLRQLEMTPFDSRLENKAMRLGVLAMSVHGVEACVEFLKDFPGPDSPEYAEVLYCKGGCARTACLDPDGSAVERIMKIWEVYD